MNTILVIPLLLSSTVGQKPASPVEFPFLIGAEWKESTPQAAKDLFVETGCNFVRLTGGGYGWAIPNHVKALQYLQAHGIKAIVQLGSHWPDGKYLDWKDDYFVDDQGKTGERNGWGVGYGGQFWPAMSYASAGYRKGLEQDFSAYLAALKPYPNISALLLHNEPGYFWQEDRVFDYNPQSIQRFRDWLPSQYGSITDLNRRWGASFGSFQTVEPPRQRTPVTNIAAWMDWRRFNAWMIQDFLSWESAFAKRERPDLPNMTNLAGPIDTWYPLRLGDNYRFASASDAACIDIYPGEWTNRFYTGFAADMTHGVAQGRPVVIAESESYDPTSFTGLTDTQLGERLKCDLWTYIGHGARGVLIWSLNGEDKFTLTHGEFNPRVAALRETAHLAKMVGMDDFTRPRPSVAMCIDPDTFLYFGGLNSGRNGSNAIQSAIQGMYAAIVQSGWQVDVISADQVRCGIADKYKAVILATPAIADAALAERLFAYVRGGGLVIAESPCAQWDPWGAPASWSALRLTDLFGATPASPVTNRTAGPQFDWRAAYTLTAGKSPVLPLVGFEPYQYTVRHVGKGDAILLNFDLGMADTDGNSPSATKTLERLLKRYGHLPPQGISAKGSNFIDVSFLSGPKGNLLGVLANPTDKKSALKPQQHVELSLAPEKAGSTRQVFLLGSSRLVDGQIEAGAMLLTPTSAGASAYSLPEVVSAAPILIARDHAPLITLRCLPEAKVGMRCHVQVTVWNPSPRAAIGTVTLSAPTGWSGVEDRPFKVAPWTHTTLDWAIVPSRMAGRAVIFPVLKVTLPPGAAKRIVGVPIDIHVSG